MKQATSTSVAKGLQAGSELLNKYSLSKCGHGSVGSPSKPDSSPNKYSAVNISKAPAK